jgi:hypothetical protein
VDSLHAGGLTLKQIAGVSASDRAGLAASATPAPLCGRRGWDWMLPPGSGGSMKTVQPRESSPLYVWLAFVLIGFGALAYFAGYLMIEEIIAFFK